MKILVVGKGGREHAIAWKLAQSNRVDQLFIAPGNPGTAQCGTNVDIAVDDSESLLQFVHDRQIDLTVVGPEQPLVDGIVDRFRESGRRIVGPTAAASMLEGSKAYAKDFMQRYHIPTAGYGIFRRSQYREATDFLNESGIPIVIKASGLAAGKGAVVCTTRRDAETTLKEMMTGGAFGSAADIVVIEEFMEGEEASVFALCDGDDYVCLATAQDHKRIGEGDTGPNTGGMGAYAPAPVVTDDVLALVKTDIIERVLDGMKADGEPYTGFLFVGLMIEDGHPRVVEFNCRLGDPEAQVVLPLLQSDFAELLMASAEGNLSDYSVVIARDAAAGVVIASDGYPGSYETGKTIKGLDQIGDGTLVFHAGTRDEAGRLLTAGGRVLNVVATGEGLAEALQTAYAGIRSINFDGAQYRRDIGFLGLSRLESIESSIES